MKYEYQNNFTGMKNPSTNWPNKELAIKFKQFLVEERGFTVSSTIHYLYNIGKLYKVSSSEILETCKKYSDVAGIIRTMKTERNLSDRTAYKLASEASVFFGWAKREGLIENNPMADGHTFRKNEAKLPAFIDWDSEEMKKIIYNPNHTMRMSMILLTLKSSGVRASELCTLKIFDVEDKWLRIRQGKGQKERYAPIDEETRKMFDLYIPWLKRHYSGDCLFTTEDFKPLNPHTLGKWIHNIGLRHGIRLYPHLFRHSLGGKLSENGMPLTIIRDILGHANVSTTSIYVHHKPSEVRKAYDLALQGSKETSPGAS